MPRAPRYEQQVSSAQLPNARFNVEAPIEAFGGGRSATAPFEAAGNLFDQATKIAMEEKQKADDLATIEYQTKLNRFQNDRFYNTKDGAMTRRGRDAFGVVDDYGKQFDDYADKLEQELLKNEDQRALARKIREREYTDYTGKLQRHTFEERNRYDEETTKASLEAALNDGVLNYQNPGKVQEAINRQLVLIDAHAGRTGKGEEYISMAKAEVMSKTHAEVIKRMLANGQDLAAKSHFDTHRDQIGKGEVAADLEKALEEGSVRGESQRRSDAIFGKAKSMTEAMDEARRIKNPKVRDAVEDRLKERFSLQERAKEQDQKALFDQATTFVETNKEKPPPDVYTKLSLTQMNAIDARLKHLREGTEPQTDWALYNRLLQEASQPATRPGFLQRDLFTEARSKLADAEYKELVRLQAETRRGDEKTILRLDDYLSKDQAVNSVLVQAGIDPTPAKELSPSARKELETRVGKFKDQLNRAVRAEQRTRGKELDSTEVADLAKQMLLKVKVKERGWIWDSTKDVPLFELDQSAEIEVPDQDREEIKKALQSQGAAVTDANILRVYMRKLQDGQ